MKQLVVAVTLVMVGCTSVEEKREYRQAQVDMVKVQQQSKEAIALQREQAQAQMWAAAAEIVRANPESADAFAVVMGVRVASEDDQDDTPLVTLQREENEALAVVKAVAPALVTTLGQVGIAAIQADVNKTQSDNAAAVAIADAATDADIMRNVTSMASIGLTNSGTSVSGDFYAADNIDQSVTDNTTASDSYNQSSSETQTTTTTQTVSDSYNSTETNSSSQDIVDSYNNTETTSNTETTNNTESTTTTDSYNTTETNTVTDSYNETNDTYNSQDVYNQQVYETTEGTFVTYEDLEALLAAGIRVTVVIDGEEVEVEQANCPDGSDGLTFGGGEAVCG